MEKSEQHHTFRSAYHLILANRFRPAILCLLVVCCLTGAGFGLLTIIRPPHVGLYAEYYDNQTCQGAPSFTSRDTEFSTHLLQERQQRFPQNVFTIVWNGYLYIPETRPYTFVTTSDDGSWLFIDDQLVVDNGGAHGLREVRQRVALKKGIHRIAIRYLQIGGYAALEVAWATNQLMETPLPSSYLLPPDTNMRRAKLYYWGKSMLWSGIFGIVFLAIGIGLCLAIIRAFKALRNYHENIVVLAFFLIVLVVGISIFDDYGISWDEPMQRTIGMRNYAYITQGYRELFDDTNEKYYGPAFELFLVFLEDKLHLDETRTIYLMRHLITFLLFYLSVICFYFLCQHRFSSRKIGLLGSLFLLLSPRIFAHAFYNSKDLPFLSLFLISMYTLVRYRENMSLGNACLHALCCAILIDIRILGIMVPGLTFFFIGSELFLIRASNVPVRRVLLSLSVYSILFISFTILGFPVLWESPLRSFYQAFLSMKRYPWESTVLYLGKETWSTALPWHYIPVWMAVTTPILYLIGFLLGLWRIIKYQVASSKYQVATDKGGEGGIVPPFSKRGLGGISSHRRFDLLIGCWFFLPLLAIILSKSVLYDTWRHLFFVYPAFLMIALHGIIFGWQVITTRFQGRIQRVLSILFCGFVCLGLLEPIVFMIRHHPYQNLYFNRLAGKDMPTIKQRFELDYWGLSLTQAVKYILQHDPRDQIRIHIVYHLEGPVANILSPEAKKRCIFVDQPEAAEYFVSNYRWHHEEYDYENEFYSISINGAKVAVVYDLRT